MSCLHYYLLVESTTLVVKEIPTTASQAETTAWLQPKKSTGTLVSQTATTPYLTAPLTGKRGQFNADFLAGQSLI